MSGTLTTTVSTKGQVILPKALRDSLHWAPGTRLTVEDTPDGVLLRAAPNFPAAKPGNVFGCLAYRGQPKTLAEMDSGITAALLDRHARGRY